MPHVGKEDEEYGEDVENWCDTGIAAELRDPRRVPNLASATM
jgi:hypothetical protein